MRQKTLSVAGGNVDNLACRKEGMAGHEACQNKCNVFQNRRFFRGAERRPKRNGKQKQAPNPVVALGSKVRHVFLLVAN